MAESASIPDNEVEHYIDEETTDPEKHYRFVQKRPQRLARLKHKGYEIVKSSVHGVQPIVEGMLTAEDTIEDGDTILMMVDKTRFLEGREKLANLNRQRMAAPKAQFRRKTRGAKPDGSDIRIVTKDKFDKE